MKSTKIKLLLLLILTAVFGCAELERNPDAGSVFQATFKSNPPQDVTDLQGFEIGFRDNSTNYLRFNAPPSTVKRLVGNTFAPTTAATFKAGISGQTPPWWRPTANSTTKYYSSTGFHPTFSSGDAYYSYDSNSAVSPPLLGWMGLIQSYDR